MNKTLNRYRFYLQPLLIITALNAIIFLTLGTYFEDYEGVNSSIIQGLYTIPCRNFTDYANHYLIMRLYENISILFPTVPVYGVIMFIYNWLSLTFLGLMLFRVLKVNIPEKNILLFILLYIILSIDNLVNLSSTRITFILLMGIITFIESRRFEQKNITNFQWAALILIMIFIALMRAEAVLLFSLIYIPILILNKRFYKKSLIPVLLGISVVLTFNFVVTTYGSEAKKVAVYKEKEMLDRSNINFARLAPGSLLELEVHALTEYSIFDKEHFTFAFYDSIAASPSNIGLRSLGDGLKIESFVHTFLNSVLESYNCWRFLLYYLISCGFLLALKKRLKSKYIYLLLGFFPLSVCLYTMVPMRFVNPYYAITGTLNILLYLKYSRSRSMVLALCIFISAILVKYEFDWKKEYRIKLENFRATQKEIQFLSKNSGGSKTIVFNKMDFDKMFPVLPLERIKPPNAVFLNFFYYNAYEFYTERWKKICHCDPLSLKEKTDYIVSSGSYFVIDEKSFAFMQHYFDLKYHVQLIKTNFGNFDQQLKICKLNYKD